MGVVIVSAIARCSPSGHLNFGLRPGGLNSDGRAESTFLSRRVIVSAIQRFIKDHVRIMGVSAENGFFEGC